MRLTMGLDKPDPARMHNPELARDARFFPPSPLISEAEWSAIQTYYLAASPVRQPPLERPLIPADLAWFESHPLRFSIAPPATTWVHIDSETHTLSFADAGTETLYVANSAGQLLSSVVVSNILTCVRPFGKSRLGVGIGDFFPSDDHFGQVLWLSNDVSSVLLADLPRVTHLEPADLNGDGRLDFALSIFGNLAGRFSWFEARPDRSFSEHVLFEKPGALKSLAHDFNGDGRPDLAVLIAQESEMLLLFTNLGDGPFSPREIFRRPPSFGHTDFALADMDGDGQPDFIVTNGDNADFSTEPRPYQGIRIYAGSNGGDYRESYFFPFYGAYQVVAADFDGDGDQDLAAVAFFADYQGSHPEPFVLLENLGGFKFAPHTFPDATDGRWLRIAAGDVDGDGDIDLALAPVVEMPDRVPEKWRALWSQKSPSVLLLRNQGRSVR